MTEGYNRGNPSGDCPFNICPSRGDCRAQIAGSIIISALFGTKCFERTGQATNAFVKCGEPPGAPIPGHCVVSCGHLALFPTLPLLTPHP